MGRAVVVQKTPVKGCNLVPLMPTDARWWPLVPFFVGCLGTVLIGPVVSLSHLESVGRPALECLTTPRLLVRVEHLPEADCGRSEVEVNQVSMFARR